MANLAPERLPGESRLMYEPFELPLVWICVAGCTRQFSPMIEGGWFGFEICGWPMAIATDDRHMASG